MKDSQSIIEQLSGHFRQTLSRYYRKYIERLESQLASQTADRIVREFEWGLEWTRSWPCAIQDESGQSNPFARLKRLNRAAIENSRVFFSYKIPSDFKIQKISEKPFFGFSQDDKLSLLSITSAKLLFIGIFSIFAIIRLQCLQSLSEKFLFAIESI